MGKGLTLQTQSPEFRSPRTPIKKLAVVPHACDLSVERRRQRISTKGFLTISH